MDLRLRRGAQRGELGPVTDQLAQLPLLSRGDERFGQITAAQPVGQLGRVAHVVLDPPGVPVQAKRVHQMHPGAVGLQQVGRPVPAIGRLERHLGIRSGLRYPRRRTPPGRSSPDPRRAPDRPRSCARSRIGAGAGRCPRTVVAVPPRSPSVDSGLVCKPRVCSPRSVPDGGRRPGGGPTPQQPSTPLSEQRRRPHHNGPSRRSGAALLHDISSRACRRGPGRPRTRDQNDERRVPEVGRGRHRQGCSLAPLRARSAKRWP
jgi:hypothetical protein